MDDQEQPRFAALFQAIGDGDEPLPTEPHTEHHFKWNGGDPTCYDILMNGGKCLAKPWMIPKKERPSKLPDRRIV